MDEHSFTWSMVSSFETTELQTEADNDPTLDSSENQQTIIDNEDVDDLRNDQQSLYTSTIYHRNNPQEEDQLLTTTTTLFEPLRSLLSTLIDENRQMKQQINQFHKQYQLCEQFVKEGFNNQCKENEYNRQHLETKEQLQAEINQLKTQYEINEERFNEHIGTQLRKNDAFDDRIRKIESSQSHINQLIESNQRTVHEQLKAEVNFMKQENTLEHKLIEQVQTEINQLKTQSPQNEQLLNDRSRKNDKFENHISELVAKNHQETRIEMNQLESKYQHLIDQSKENEHVQFDIKQLKEEFQLQQQSSNEQFGDRILKIEEHQSRINQLIDANRQKLIEYLKKHEQIKVEINRIKEENILEHKKLAEQFKDLDNKHDLDIKQTDDQPSNEQSRKIEDCQADIKQIQLQQQSFIEELREQIRKTDKLEICIKQLTENKQQSFRTTNEGTTQDENLLKQLKNEIEFGKRNLTDLFNHQSKINEQYENDIKKIKENIEHNGEIDRYYKSLIPFLKHLHNTKWKQNAVTVAGGNYRGDRLNQLDCSHGICIDDDDQTIYIADSNNSRIIEWKVKANQGRIVAGGNGKGNQLDQLCCPIGVVIDKKNNSSIIADRDNRRVMEWSREHNTQYGQVIISDIDSYGITIDQNGDIYVCDFEKNEVRRWSRNEQEERIVAGGNGKGNQLYQLNYPTNIFVDDNLSVYVSDSGNHRIIKWMKDADTGIIVAGGNGQGNSLNQLSHPEGVIVDRLGHIYIVDSGNHRVMCWCEGDSEGSIVVGNNGDGTESDQLSYPTGLLFDQQGNLYVSDNGNDRIQKFDNV